MFGIEIECLRSLYIKQKVTKSKIDELFQSKKITEDEKNYILGKEGE